MQALPAPSESLCIIEMGGASDSADGETGNIGIGGLFLNIGLQVNSILFIARDKKCACIKERCFAENCIGYSNGRFI